MARFHPNKWRSGGDGIEDPDPVAGNQASDRAANIMARFPASATSVTLLTGPVAQETSYT